MIHLVPGDYLVYYPSEKEKENIIRPSSSIGFGFIFYYQDNLDLSDYQLAYNIHIHTFKSVQFIIISCLWLFWVFVFILLNVCLLINKKYNVKIEDSMSNISIIADLYQEIHMLSLDSDTGYLIKGNKSSLLFSFFGTRVSEYFNKYIEEDCHEACKEDFRKFLDLTSIRELLENGSTISFAYQSKKQGWVLLRFFKLNNSKKNNHLVLAVQNINNQKIKEQNELESAKQDEFTQLVRNNFLNSVTASMQSIMGSIVQTNEALRKTLTSEAQVNMSSAIDKSIEHIKILQNFVNDMYKLEAGSLELECTQYNIYDFFEHLCSLCEISPRNPNCEFQTSIQPDIPEILEGDIGRIQQILMILLISSFMVTEKGFTKMSVFAKQKDDVEDIIFSIRDSGNGFTVEQLKELNSFLAGNKINSFENPSLVYVKIIDGILKNMNSELKVVSVYGEGTEFYFTIPQKIIKKVK